MINEWYCSTSNYLGSLSVDELDLPASEPKWMLDVTTENIVAMNMCMVGGFLYFISHHKNQEFIRCVSLESGVTVWRKSYDFKGLMPLSVNETYACFGHLILDRISGDKIFDLKEACGDLDEDEITLLADDKVLVFINNENVEKKYILFDLVSKQYRDIECESVVTAVANSYVLGKLDNKVSKFSLEDNKNDWQFDLIGGTDRFCRIISNGAIVIVKNNKNISFLDVVSGALLKSYSQEKLSSVTGVELIFESDIYLLCTLKHLVILKNAKDKSWLVLISLDDFSICSCTQQPLYGGFCLAGDYLFGLGKDFYPIAMRLPNFELCWEGKSPISSSKVIAGNNHVIYAFSGGGFQCYGPD